MGHHPDPPVSVCCCLGPHAPFFSLFFPPSFSFSFFFCLFFFVHPLAFIVRSVLPLCCVRALCASLLSKACVREWLLLPAGFSTLHSSGGWQTACARKCPLPAGRLLALGAHCPPAPSAPEMGRIARAPELPTARAGGCPDDSPRCGRPDEYPLRRTS